MQQTPRANGVTYSQLASAGVRAEAARLGVTGRQIAAHLDIGPNAASRKMREHVSFTIDELGMLAELFGHTLPDGTPDVTVFLRVPQDDSLYAVA